jgi:hypothetical protein
MSQSKWSRVTHLWLVGAELTVAICQPLQANGKLDITTADGVLNLELGELCVKAELLDNPRVLSRGEMRVILRLGTSDDHLSRGEDEGSHLGIAFLACKVMVLRLRRQSRLTVATIFWRVGMMPSTALMSPGS